MVVRLVYERTRGERPPEITMAYINNEFCWHGILSTDVDKAKAFYTEVLGWTAADVDMGGQTSTMLAAAGVQRAHLMAPPVAGIPSHWENYLRVDDVDARTAAAVEAGGTLVMPAMDIPPGRFSVIASPSGAHLHLFHEADEASATNPPDGDGSIHWVELHSKDLDADVAWLKAFLGLTTETMDMPDGKYFVLKDGDTQVGGAMAGMNPDAPAMWLTWVRVADVDACLARVTQHGGAVHAPIMEVPGIGRMAVVADNTGGVFGIITPPAT
ncbi:MAG: VOC family protein [Proteobacteria bacterium]|nr:VOC family protein [Pseudomonadota bacterium]